MSTYTEKYEKLIKLIDDTTKNIWDACTKQVLVAAREVGLAYAEVYPNPSPVLETKEQVAAYGEWARGSIEELTDPLYARYEGTSVNVYWINSELQKGVLGDEPGYDIRPVGRTQVNRYKGHCIICGNLVPARAGTLWKNGRVWRVAHLACIDSGEPSVTEIRTSGGTFYRNSRGRCEDAPCCGCCTI